MNPRQEHELFLPDARAAGKFFPREAADGSQGANLPGLNQFHAHGYVNEINDAVECALEPNRAPQSGPLLAWDSWPC